MVVDFGAIYRAGHGQALGIGDFVHKPGIRLQYQYTTYNLHWV